MNGVMEYAPYSSGTKYCSGCGIYLITIPVPVLVALKGYEQKQRRRRMTENKAQLSNWIEDIVAFHKAKRKFVSLKDMESENADQFLICEFKGYDFEIMDN
jgi:hypothetical protein